MWPWLSGSISPLPTTYPPVGSTCSIIAQPKQREESRLLCPCCSAKSSLTLGGWWSQTALQCHCMSLNPECQLDAKEMWLEWPWSRSWLSPMQMWWSPWELQPESTANLDTIMGSSHRRELAQLWLKKKGNYQEKLPCSSYDCRDGLVNKKAIQQGKKKKKKAHGEISILCFSIERVSACSRKSHNQRINLSPSTGKWRNNGGKLGRKLCHTRDWDWKLPIYKNRVAFFLLGDCPAPLACKIMASQGSLISKGTC